MSPEAEAAALRLPAARRHAWGEGLGRGAALGYLSIVVLLPLAAVAWRAVGDGAGSFWQAVSSPAAVAALELTFGAALAITAVNAVMGTLIAWVLVRDRFPGAPLVNALVDLPFALPTIVAGLTLLALYGPRGPIGVNVAYTRIGVGLALLFVTLPFVVRAVQPMLLSLDREAEEAAASLGAGAWTRFRRIILPVLVPSILTGAALSFARAVGEFGSVVLISGNIPFKTEVSSVHVFGLVESDAPGAAAAVSIVLLALSLVALLTLDGIRRWRSRHEN